MRSLTAASFLLFLTATLLFSPSIGGIILTILTPSQPLAVGDTLVSPGRIFALGFFTAGNSSNRYVGIWYYKIPKTVVWVANRQNPIASLTANLSITAEGALVITDKGTMIWSSDLSGLKNARAQIADSGNLVVGEATDNSKNPVRIVDGGWQSFDHPTDTMLPGMKLEWWRNGKSGRSSNLTAWSSENDPTPSTYVVEIDSRNGLEFLLQSNGRRIWRSGPWNETHFTGILGTNNFIMGLNISKPIDSDESDESEESEERERNQVLIHQSSLNFSSSVLLSRVTVDHSGIIRLLEWQEASKTWEVSWSAPGDQCDNISACGPFGICDTGGSSSSMCSCLPGFEPKSPANWKAMNWSEGCVRKTKVKLCMTSSKSPADVYTAVKDVKMPDTTSAEIANCQDCAENCLKICTCTAYAFVIPNNRHNCIMWFSELKDLRKYITSDEQVIYVRVTEADLRSHTHQRRNIAIVVSAFLGALALLLALVGFVFLKKKINRRNNGLTVILGYIGSPYSPNADRGGEMNDFELPLFDLSIIEAATNHFSVENKIGEGGFGPVYKGQLRDGETIAVKRLAKTSIQGPDEFKNEVMLIAKLQHRNLVRILGCCMQGDERILIYEYMPNGSLDAFLFDKSGRRSLDWGTRYSIILGIARGLVYLHQDSRFRVIHRDLKASNILLDKDMNPKISDFGIARMFDGEDTSVNTARVVGTYGYMSPEYAMDGIFSVKSDVYSFGVLVLEIISGKRNRGIYAPKCNENLLGLAWSLWGEGNSLQLVDESMHLSFPLAQVTRCIQLGLLCVQERPEDRPTMSSVVLLLGSETAYLRYPKQPGFVAMKSRSDLDSSSSMQLPTTANDIPITTLEGR